MSKNQKNLSKNAVKGSTYTLASILIMKLSGLILTLIIARILLPELYGIYSLIISIIGIASIFTDFGIDNTFIRFFSEEIGKKNKAKARSILRYLLKIKGIIISIVILVILIFSKYISYNIYDKPLLFYPLVASVFLITIESLKKYFGSFYIAVNDLRPLPYTEVIHQLLKISLSFIAIYLLRRDLKVAGLLLAFTVAGLIHLLLFIYIAIRKDSKLLLGKKEKFDNLRLGKYLKNMSVASISLVVFTSIDTLMLGMYVGSEFLGYYGAALGLILTISSMYSLSPILLPVFTQINNKQFKRGFEKTLRYILYIAIPSVAGIVSLGNYLIFAIYGKEYLPATPLIYILSLLIVISPLNQLYKTILQSKEKTGILAKGILIALVINIILNYLLLEYLLDYGQIYAVMGVATATVLSRFLLLFIFAYKAHKSFKISVRVKKIFISIFSALIMSLFLTIFNSYYDINIFLGILEIVLASMIYLTSLYLLGGIKKDEIYIIKLFIPKF